MRRLLGVLALSIAVAGAATGLNAASPATQEAAKPQNSIKEVMVKAHKDGLLKKILANEGTQEDKVKLMDLYIDMLEGTPKKGEQNDWLMAAGRSVVAAGKVVAGREGSIEELKAATNCKACHDPFK